MDSAAVRLWRDTFRLNLSASWKHDVEITVTDLDLWKKILDGWGYWRNGKWIKKAPGIKNLLTEYERLKADEIPKPAPRQTEYPSARGPQRISERSASVVPVMLDRKNGWAG